jgi:fucose permease
MQLTQDSPAKSGLFPPHRLAISALFLANGFTVGSWAPMIPEFKTRLGVDEGGLGLLILAFGIGSLVAMPVVGALIAKNGSRRITLLLGAVMCLTLMAVIHAPNTAFGFVALFATGALVGGMDVAMNANAVSVERNMHKAIMSSCHGFWSLGGVIGAGAGGWLIAEVGTEIHVLLVAIISAILVSLAWRFVFHDSTEHSLDSKTPKAALPRAILPYAIGALALACMIPEGAVIDWGALYLRQELGADVVQSGLAFAAFSTTMAVMRFAGDGIRGRLGAVLTLRISALIACIGLLVASQAATPLLAILGFGFAGLGVANMVPIAFSAAGNLPGYAPGVAISVVTFMGYSGILFVPSLIGFIAEHTGFARIFFVLGIGFMAAFFASKLARHADGITQNTGH